MKKLIQLVILFLLSHNAFAQANITEEKTSTWNKFEKVAFKFNGIEAWYVKPSVAAKGNPWVWRAHFPSWHTEMDSVLLERGFYVAYINTNDLFGHPKAMMIWDDFYNYLVKERNFAPKVALEGVSRGGLYVYGWAKRNPAKVSCIYTETPVLDFKSWPGGKGIGKGSPKDWAKLLEVYHLTEEEALKYDDLPINNLDGLAAYKVPILHVIGLQDSLAPPVENTDVLVKNYISKGGPATVVPMTKGKQTLSGHHFSIEGPEKLADFIYQNSMPVIPKLKDEDFIQMFGQLSNIAYRIKKEKKATVAFLGGSITNMKGWRDKVCTYLKELYPETDFTFINAGIPSLGSVPHVFRLKNDVLDKGRIDLMFIESAVNDYGNGTSEQQQRKALEGIVRHAYQVNPNINMIMMAFVDEDKIADYKVNKIPVEVKVHQDIAKHYQIPFINLAEAVSRRIEAGEFTWDGDFKNLHPSPFGQEIYFSEIKTLIRKGIKDNLTTQLTAFKLPLAIQKYAYTKGDYVGVEKAVIKKDFVLDPSWKPKNKVNTRPGFVNVPVLSSTNPDAELSFSFTGNAVGIAILAGPDAGTISYTIDGKNPKIVDLYTQWSKNLHLPWYLVLGDELAKGKHVLTIKVLANHNEKSLGNACRIVHFLVNSNEK
ncbi:SGNH/GDSL hydrolase family protein [Pedobacter boryungensis]|uniref:SGNH/GDSL hydrolase family protein n=1 Tax=Pedobacter boryungensis TaxID=869962 RepID=A0ABX2DAE2_9SPHI|nr:SGNH/GDSL hydrolase family protein [Pedobacter boryungensis]NQX31038.1 SGNH/GDSL hydrolase family protein [Pedobacter boryungensis]